MDLGFNLHIDHCNTPYVIGFICVMVMVVVLFVSAKGILSKLVNKEKKETKEEVFENIKLLEQKRDDE